MHPGTPRNARASSVCNACPRLQPLVSVPPSRVGWREPLTVPRAASVAKAVAAGWFAPKCLITARASALCCLRWTTASWPIA
eukprot:5189278-Pyramimonas_sp.AAC.1